LGFRRKSGGFEKSTFNHPFLKRFLEQKRERQDQACLSLFWNVIVDGS
jgi:hypothetical protein